MNFSSNQIFFAEMRGIIHTPSRRLASLCTDRLTSNSFVVYVLLALETYVCVTN